MTSAYQVDPYAPQPRNRVVFQLLERLVEAQEESIAQIRAAEEEVRWLVVVNCCNDIVTRYGGVCVADDALSLCYTEVCKSFNFKKCRHHIQLSVFIMKGN